MGDFLELWKANFFKILKSREALFDKLSLLDVCYVPGNHDDAVKGALKSLKTIHPFFESISKPFIQKMGEKSIKFMHGHEVDPLIPNIVINYGKVMGLFSSVADLRGGCLVSDDQISDALMEVCEQVLSGVKWFAAKLGLAMDEVSHFCHGIDDFRRSNRTKKMLLRYHSDKNKDFYDVVVVGHSHREGSFADWYYNSGSWTGKSNNFLSINPSGDIEILDWTEQGPKINNNMLN